MILHLTTTDLQPHITSLPELLGKTTYTVLYFYPKDNTPGCTVEAKEFTELLPDFHASGAQVIGISKDPQKSHCKFISDHELTLPLISDESLELHQQFGARGERSMYGKKFMGTLRSTFLLDGQGSILHERKNVTPKWHAQEVLNILRTQNSSV